jgi:putative FmdB family regulatory protein
MPTYDYICDSCSHEFEAFESIKADPQKVCPECSRETLRRKLGPGAAILFKGSGFYQTDYRSESYKKAAKADAPGDGGGSKSETKSEGKTETKAAPAASGSAPSSS